jgi:hypothetical protein
MPDDLVTVGRRQRLVHDGGSAPTDRLRHDLGAR